MKNNKILIFILGCFVATSINAAVTQQDMNVVARTLSFVNKPYTGKLQVGIVYTPDISQSNTEAAELQKILAGGLTIGDLTLEPVMVNINDIESANVRLFFLTGGMGNKASSLPAVSEKKQILCITTDITQVDSGRCAVGVASYPRVDITVNSALAAKSGIKFATSFRMLINEI